MNRRTFLAGVAAAVATAATGVALGRKSNAGQVLRVGVMANLTHAPMLAGLGSGRIAQALAPVAIESRVFRAGPRVTEALIGDAIDVGTTGPAPAVVHHARHSSGSGENARGGLRILGGCSSGGASLVVTRRSRFASAEHLHGKSLAVTQIGTTQDLALRAYLSAHDLRDTTAGGDVRVIAVAGATVLAQMKAGELDGAWLPEPWATRIVRELDAVRFIDERDLWPERRFSTAVLVARADRAADAAVRRLATALEDEVARALRDPAATRGEAYAELARAIGNPGKRADFDAAWGFIDFTTDPVRASVEELARRAKHLGLIPESSDTAGLFPRDAREGSAER